MPWPCSACSRDNEDAQRFCTACGTAHGCPHCHTLNAPDARYCGGCGRALARSGLAAFTALWGKPGDDQGAILGFNRAEILITVEIERARLLGSHALRPQHLNQSAMDDLFA